MAALRVFHIVNNISTDSFKDERIKIFQKSLKIQAPLNPTRRFTINIEMLNEIIHQCQFLSFPVMFRPLYPLAFFSFLRMSNILPHSTTSFDETRQLARGDIILNPQRAVVIIKWSKTMHNRS